MTNDEAALVERLTKHFTDQGRLIEAGWAAMNAVVLPPTASDLQRSEMRKAFYGGAQHLFASLTGMVGDDDGEPTGDELRRMELIAAELEAYVDELRAEVERGQR